MTTNDRYVEMAGYEVGFGNCFRYNDGAWYLYDETIHPKFSYAIIEADIRKQLIAAGWSLTWVADNPGQTTYYTIDKMTLTGAQHYNEFSDYAAALLYGITIERELYGVKEGA